MDSEKPPAILGVQVYLLLLILFNANNAYTYLQQTHLIISSSLILTIIYSAALVLSLVRSKISYLYISLSIALFIGVMLYVMFRFSAPPLGTLIVLGVILAMSAYVLYVFGFDPIVRKYYSNK